MSPTNFRCALTLSAALGLTMTPPATAQTGPGDALSFDGTSSYAQVPHAAALDAYPLTIMAWFNSTQTTTVGLVNKYVSSSFSGYQILIDATGIHAWYSRDQLNNVYGALDGGAVADGQWHHAAFVVDATGGSLYVDGTLKSTLGWTGTPGPTTTTEPLSFGVYPGTVPTAHFNGQMDEVSLWQTNLTAAQIQKYWHRSLTGNEAGLLGYWRFDEGSGTNVANGASSGSNYNATLYFSPAWVISGVPFIPDVITLAATAITPTSATLNGMVNPGNLPTTAWFQWGATTNYGNFTTTNSLPATNAALAVNNVLSGLVPPTTVHFVVVAANSAGTNQGTDQTFTIPVFTNINAGLPGLTSGSVAWGDYDNDGRLDVLLSGQDAGNNRITQVWRNTGNGFSNINAGLPGVVVGSVAWGDCNNDGRLDILLSGYDAGSHPITQVWRNTGSGFSNINAGLPAVFYGSVAWGDYNNDGRLDILLSGFNAITQPITQVWRNTGNGFTNVTSTVAPGLPGVTYSSVAWGDYDNDGWLDILLSGFDAGNHPIAQVWRNTGSGFTNINAGLPGVCFSSVAWGDYDNDGRLDILLSGLDAGNTPITQVWRNTGSRFTNINAGLPAVSHSSVAWGDYDNDGWLDILLSGRDAGNNPITQVWRNTGNGFININAGLPGVGFSSVGWGDYDNDGRLDILLAGQDAASNPNPLTQVWLNQTLVTNSPPAAPSGLAVALSGSILTLSWNASSDAQTPASGLNYNLRVGTTPGGSDIVGPMARSSGRRLLPQMGNVQQRLSASLSASALYNYYWSVQAVDGAFAGSPFATESSFNLFPVLLSLTRTNFVPGDINGDGIVSQTELAGVLARLDPNGAVDQMNLNLVLANYFPYSPWLYLTNVAGLGGSNVTFALTNLLAGAFSVQYSSNLSDWQFLGPRHSALPVHRHQRAHNSPALLPLDLSVAVIGRA